MEKVYKKLIIIVHGKIHISPFDTLLEFFNQEIPKLFFQHFHSDFPAFIESTSSMFVKSNHLRLKLKLDTKWVEFQANTLWTGQEKLHFVPHEDSDTNIYRLCVALNELQKLLNHQVHEIN